MGGETDVETFGLQAGGDGLFFEGGAAGGEGGFHVVAQVVQGGAAKAALVGGRCAEFAQEPGEGAGFAEEVDAEIVQRAEVWGLGDAGQREGAQRGNIVRHGGPVGRAGTTKGRSSFLKKEAKNF